MPIAAVPNYLGKDFSQASPGQRFSMYLPLWSNPQFTLEKDSKVSALKEAKKLNASDREVNQALLTRQAQTFSSLPATDGLCLRADAIAPFTTGLGNEHPLENGFAFLNPYGLPYLPGSGVKGVLRQAARELASGQWDNSDWHHSQDNKRHEVQDRRGKRLFDASDMDVLFGSMADDGKDHLRGTLSFWDVIPQIKGDCLMVEIMTPHQSHYYQPPKEGKDSGKKAAGSASPHDSGLPIPITFLTVPPGSGFAFHVVCDSTQLARLAPDLANNDRWKTLLTQAFEHAFSWIGFGAKTAVGYGAFERNTKAEEKNLQAQAAIQAAASLEARLSDMTAQSRSVEEFAQICAKRFDALRGSVTQAKQPKQESKC